MCLPNCAATSHNEWWQSKLASCLHGVFSMDAEESPKKCVLVGIIFDGQKSQARDSGWKDIRKACKKGEFTNWWVWVQASWRAVMWTRHKFSSARDLTILSLNMHTQREDLNTGTRPCGKPVERLCHSTEFISSYRYVQAGRTLGEQCGK